MDSYPLFPGFWETDTSFEAAEQIAPVVSQLKKSVLETIKRSNGLTANGALVNKYLPSKKLENAKGDKWSVGFKKSF